MAATKHHIAIFASGQGSNTRKLIEYFRGHPSIEVSLIVTNNPESPIIDFDKEFGISVVVIDKQELDSGFVLLPLLQMKSIDFIVLAGFLLLVPQRLIEAYPKKIVNLHPALLPKYGGKGMFGMRVHQAVKDAGEEETGISIHYINEEYDKGDLIAQFNTPLTPRDTPATIAAKVQQLEHTHYPPTIERLLTQGA